MEDADRASFLCLLDVDVARQLYSPFPDELLFIGSRFGKPALVTQALDNGAFLVNTALLLACAHCHLDVATLLIQRGATDFDSCLRVSTDPDVISFLQRRGASTDCFFLAHDDFVLAEGPEGVLVKRTVATVA